MMSTIDVVIPLFNGEKWINECLDSVFSQTRPPEKVFVVDDGSHDQSVRAVEQVGGAILLKSGSKGPSGARNTGLKASKAQYIAFLDQDDLWHPRHLEILCNALDEHADLPLAASMFKIFMDGQAPVFDIHDQSVALENPWDVYPCLGITCNPSVSLFRREALADIGWPSEHCGMADYSLWMKISAVHPVLRVRAASVAYRQHKASYYAHLKKDKSAYISLWTKVIDDLFSYRCNAAPGDIRSIEERRQVVHHFRGILEAQSSLSEKEFKEKLDAFANNLEKRDTVFLKKFLRMIVDFISHGPTHGTLLALLDHWPESASKSRAVFMDKVIETRPGLSFYLQYITSKPWRFQKLSLFGTAIRERLSFH